MLLQHAVRPACARSRIAPPLPRLSRCPRPCAPRTLAKTGAYDTTNKSIIWTITTTRSDGPVSGYALTGSVDFGVDTPNKALVVKTNTNIICTVTAAATCNLAVIGQKTCPFTCPVTDATVDSVTASYDGGDAGIGSVTFTPKLTGPLSADLLDIQLNLMETLFNSTTITVAQPLTCPSKECRDKSVKNKAFLKPAGGATLEDSATVSFDCLCPPPPPGTIDVGGAGTYEAPVTW